MKTREQLMKVNEPFMKMKSLTGGEKEKTSETSNDAKLDTTLSHIIKALKQVR